MEREEMESKEIEEKIGVIEQQSNDIVVQKELKESLQGDFPLKEIIEILNNYFPGYFLEKLLLFFYCIGSLIKTSPLEHQSNHQTIIIVTDNLDLRTRFVLSILELFPEEIICKYYGLGKLTKQNLSDKKIIYFTDFETRGNRRLIKIMTKSQKDIIYEEKSGTVTLPKMTIITTTTREILLKNKDLMESCIIIELPCSFKNSVIISQTNSNKLANQGRNFKIGKKIEEKKSRVIEFINSLISDTMTMLEIPNIKSLKKHYNYHVPNVYIFHNFFEQLIKNIAFFYQEKRHSYYDDYDDINEVKVVHAHHLDVWYAIEIGKKLFIEITQDLSEDLRDFVKYLLNYVEDPNFLRDFKKKEQVADGDGFFFTNNAISGYKLVCKEKNQTIRSDETYRMNILMLSYNTKDSLSDCLFFKKEGKFNKCRFNNLPAIRYLDYTHKKEELEIEYNYYIAAAFSDENFKD